MSKELFLKALQEKYAKKTAKTDDGEGMDAPGAEDGDVDNDGDEDKSDAYLLKRRKAVAKAMKEDASSVTSGHHKDIAHHVKTIHDVEMKHAHKDEDSEHAYKGGRDNSKLVSAHRGIRDHHLAQAKKHEQAGNKSAAEDHHFAARAHNDSATMSTRFHSPNYSHGDYSAHSDHALSLSKDAHKHKVAESVELEDESLEESLAGAVIGGLGGHALGKAYQGAAGSLAAKGAKALGKGPLGQTLARSTASKFAPAAGAAVGTIAGHQATKKRRNESLDEDFDMDLIMEEYGDEIFDATAEFLLDEGIDYRDLTEEELNEIIGRMARAVGRGIKRQTVDRVTTKGRTDRMNRAAAKDEKKAADRKAFDAAKARAAKAKADKKKAYGPSTADKVKAATASSAKKAGAAVKSTAKKLMQ